MKAGAKSGCGADLQFLAFDEVLQELLEYDFSSPAKAHVFSKDIQFRGTLPAGPGAG
ncbi:MAG: hypothetical protein JOY62_14780 [Acidobacteriaceae bacterium]|nr:hypothetical protein [Acidobacteriaceae bacterium]MBV9781226.1 hypothetical protein [Acidobacteriaceae bacterium]